MASPPRTPEREEERRLNVRTLVIASAASATAAAVTSQLWIAGTWLAAAVTPVLVTLLSEILNRPTEKIANAWTAERPQGPPPSRTPEERPQPSFRPSNGADPPVRIYRQPSARTPQRKGRIAIGVVAATAAIAFGITVVAITAGELISGDSIGKGGGRTTFFRGNGNESETNERTTTSEEREQTTPAETETTPTTPTDETVPDETTEPTTTTPAPAPQTPTPQSETTPAP